MSLLALVLEVTNAQQSPLSPSPDEQGFPKLSGLEELLASDDLAAPKAPSVKTSARLMAYPDGKTGLLQVAADISPGWHLYSITQPKGGPVRTEIVVEPTAQFEITGPFTPNEAPRVVPSEYFPVPEEYHEERVYWTAPIAFAEGVDPTTARVQGHLKGQICNESCMMLKPDATAFTGGFAQVITPMPVEKTAPATGSANPQGQPNEVTAAGGSELSATVSGTSLLSFETLKYLVFALLGGFILNFMPCVLPVIGLKIMSFTQQAGQDPKRVFWLNVAFVAGLISVFMVLACLAVFLGWGWGQQFQRPEFSIFLVCVVFAFALSFLGVWEIPIPGFVGSGKAADVAEKEGATGAFLKGVLTTLLATPCSGPLIVPTLTWALRQPKPLVFSTFFCMGLGMGLPYVILGMSPQLARMLPKPGKWMETFKEIMGFVLLATVVWIFNSIDRDYFLPTLALLFTLWAACWWVGRIPITAEFGTKLKGYAVAGLFAAVLGLFAFRVFEPTPQFHWEDYTKSVFEEYRDEGKTVFVDFTANWCLTCKVNEKAAVKTKVTQEFLKRHGIVPLIADFSKSNPEADQLLEQLGNTGKGIPYYAIFPGDGGQPVAFNDFPLTQAGLIERLQSAVPETQVSNGHVGPSAIR